jgi:hypothetical protein
MLKNKSKYINKYRFCCNSLFAILICLITSYICSCTKEDFSWNLKKAPEISSISTNVNNFSEFEIAAKCLSSGFDENVETGFCWSLSSNPTLDDNIIPIQKNDEGVFSNIFTWTTASTYHFRAYVKNSIATVYSEDCVVTWPGTSTLPQVQTTSVDQLSFYSFNVNCAISSTGGNPITEKGAYLYDSPAATTPTQTIFSSNVSNNYSLNFSGLSDGTTYYVQAFASTLAGTDTGIKIIVNLPKKYNVGDTGPAGGYIIYENPDQYGSWHYLEAAPIDISSASYFWSQAASVTNFTSIEFGDGVPNTDGIYALMGNSSTYAARAAKDWSYGGASDWVLPSFNELKRMKELLFDQGIGNFISGSIYWSSSEDINYYTNAWTVKMASSGQNICVTLGKNQSFKVRALRRF